MLVMHAGNRMPEPTHHRNGKRCTPPTPGYRLIGPEGPGRVVPSYKGVLSRWMLLLLYHPLHTENHSIMSKVIIAGKVLWATK